MKRPYTSQPLPASFREGLSDECSQAPQSSISALRQEAMPVFVEVVMIVVAVTIVMIVVIVIIEVIVTVMIVYQALKEGHEAQNTRNKA